MDDIEELAEVFTAQSDQTRFWLVMLLEEQRGSLCVNALAKNLHISKPAVSQHLRVLRSVHLVEGNRQGPLVHCSLNKTKLSEYKTMRQVALGEDF